MDVALALGMDALTDGRVHRQYSGLGMDALSSHALVNRLLILAALATPGCDSVGIGRRFVKPRRLPERIIAGMEALRGQGPQGFMELFYGIPERGLGSITAKADERTKKRVQMLGILGCRLWETGTVVTIAPSRASTQAGFEPART